MSARDAKRLGLIAGGIAVVSLALIILINQGAGDQTSSVSSGPFQWRIISGKSLPITFIGYTNDATRERSVVFAITNTLSRSIDCLAAVENKEGARWPGVKFSAPSFRVPSRQGSIFTVANPNAGPWRVLILYQKTPNKVDSIGLSLRRFFHRLKMDGVAGWIPTEAARFYSMSSSEMTD